MSRQPYNLALLFEEAVEKYSDHPALAFSEQETYTYSQLNRKANSYAVVLLEAIELKRNSLICISAQKEISTFALMLACLKLGVPYVMLDDKSPVERLIRIINRANPDLVISSSQKEDPILAAAEHENVKSLKFSELEEASQGKSGENLASSKRVTGDALAYVMFTSGSTGFPKGAAMTHDNVMNFIEWSVAEYQFAPGDVLTNINALYFDNSVFDFYSALFSGATLVPFTREEVRNPSALVEKIKQFKCTSWFSVPSMLIYLQTVRAFDSKENFLSVKRFVFGGEGYPKARLVELFERYKDSAKFNNVYGPTECTCMCSSYELCEDDFVSLEGYPPLGRIFDNFSFLILDEDGSEVELGKVGELCLFGPHMGKGYYNAPKNTESAFVQNPSNTAYEEKIYKTGDLVRIDPYDNRMWILGRTDNQIKRMGYRIELEEIENALCGIDGVSRAAVVFFPDNNQGKLVAVCEGSFAENNNINDPLKKFVPNYMLVDEFFKMDKLPLNANGKMDRKAVVKYVLEKTTYE